QIQVFSPDQWVWLLAQLGHSAQYGLKRNLSLQPRQRRAKTKVVAIREGHVPVILAANVEPVRVWKPLWIAVGRTHYRDDRLAFADRLPPQLRVFWSHASCMLDGA